MRISREGILHPENWTSVLACLEDLVLLDYWSSVTICNKTWISGPWSRIFFFLAGFATLQTSHHLYVICIPPFCSVGVYNLLELSKVQAQTFAVSMNWSVLGLKLRSRTIRGFANLSILKKMIHFVSNLDRDRNYLLDFAKTELPPSCSPCTWLLPFMAIRKLR